MKFALLGATGRTGRHVVTQALDAGHEVVALARTPSKLDVQHDRLTVVQGDALDPDAVGRVVGGADAVLLTLGHAKGSPKDVLRRSASVVVDAMKRHGVRRVVTETGAGVADPRDPGGLGPAFMRGVMGVVAKPLLADSEAHVDVFRRSGLDWTAVRAPRLTGGPHTGRYETGYLSMGPGHSVSRADVADYMLRLATSDEAVGEAPMITSR
ncbi:NAD(P)-dependent oxidoreductase [Rubrivirga sp.]|uniref:NAD(P)-dependent oxidoreductase n=1 Tax=Rubrivirga sp. TaxID=1885344 RepID=UPI003B51EAB1